MKPIIRKKGKNRSGTTIYVLQWTEKGVLKTFTLNPSKLLDYIKKSNLIKEND